MDEILREVADKFKVMPDGTLKTADAMTIFGRSGAALIAILDQGSEGLDRFLGIAQKTHQFMTHAVNQFANTAWSGITEVSESLAQSAANALVYGQNFGKAMDQAVKSEAASIASEAILWVLKCIALGLYYLAVGDGPDASLAFESAGVWAAIRRGSARRFRAAAVAARVDRAVVAVALRAALRIRRVALRAA